MKCDWAVLDVFVVPPLQFIIYAMMIYETPDKHVDGLCLFGRVITILFFQRKLTNIFTWGFFLDFCTCILVHLLSFYARHVGKERIPP